MVIEDTSCKRAHYWRYKNDGNQKIRHSIEGISIILKTQANIIGTSVSSTYDNPAKNGFEVMLWKYWKSTGVWCFR